MQHARKILKYFDYSCQVEKKMENYDRIKAANTYYSIHPYTFIASYKNVRLRRRIGTATNTCTCTYARELHGKRRDLTWLTFFRTFLKVCHFITSDARIVIDTSF